MTDSDASVPAQSEQPPQHEPADPAKFAGLLRHLNSKTVIIWMAIITIFLATEAVYLYRKNIQLEQQLHASTTSLPTSTPLAITLTPTPRTLQIPTTWVPQTDTVLGITYKLPPSWGLLDLSGREIPGDTGTQYCATYVAPVSMLVARVFAGTGACGGGIFTIGTTTKNYSAGREGGFGDYAGYTKVGNKYFVRFLDSKTENLPELPIQLVSEQINAHGVTYLKVRGESHWNADVESDVVTFGTPGEGNIGALVNIQNPKYTGFSIMMPRKTPNDEMVFDQILASLSVVSL